LSGRNKTMSIETKYSYQWETDKGNEIERFLRVVRVSVDPVVLIYDDADKLLYSFDRDRTTEALAVARAILAEAGEL
jgi:hypothetical protein